MTRCGNAGHTTCDRTIVTCRVCRFGILSDAAPWAKEFLDKLRSGTEYDRLLPGSALYASVKRANEGRPKNDLLACDSVDHNAPDGCSRAACWKHK